MDKPVFKNYKEEQNYYKERYENRGKTLHVSKIINRDGKTIQVGDTYAKKGVFRKLGK